MSWKFFQNSLMTDLLLTNGNSCCSEEYFYITPRVPWKRICVTTHYVCATHKCWLEVGCLSQYWQLDIVCKGNEYPLCDFRTSGLSTYLWTSLSQKPPPKSSVSCTRLPYFSQWTDSHFFCDSPNIILHFLWEKNQLSSSYKQWQLKARS